MINRLRKWAAAIVMAAALIFTPGCAVDGVKLQATVSHYAERAKEAQAKAEAAYCLLTPEARAEVRAKVTGGKQYVICPGDEAQ